MQGMSRRSMQPAIDKTRAKQHKPNKHLRPTRSKSLITSQPCPGMRGLGTNTAGETHQREWGRGNGSALTGSTTWQRETKQKQTRKMGRSPLHTTRFPTEPRTRIWPTSSSSGVANTLDDRPPMVCQFKPPRASRDLLCTASSPRCARTATACTPRLLQNCATRDVRKEVTGAVPAAVGRPGRVGMCRRVAREKKARAKQNGQASPSTSTCQGCHLLCWQATRTPHNRPPRSPPPLQYVSEQYSTRWIHYCTQ